MATAQVYHRSNMSTSGSISRKRVGSMSQRGNETPLTPLDIQSIQMPSNPQNALALKTAALSSTKSLYQTCSHLRKRLRCVEDFPPFLDQPASAEHLDVVSHMVHLFRLGSPLCHLYNLLIPAFVDPQSPLFAALVKPKPIEYDFPAFMECPDGVRNWAKRPENAKQCQKYIAMFCMAMKQRQSEGRWQGDIWALHELWGKSSGDEVESYDSTGLMKVLHTVEAMLDHLPESAISPISPTTPYTASSQFFSAKGHVSQPSYDLPFSMGGSGSGVGAVEAMAKAANHAAPSDSTRPAMPNGGPIGGEDMSRGMSKASADSNAFKSVEELVASEKSYVQELEILVRCSTEMLAKQIISSDTNHAMFSNLSKILDFHRKFLIKLETEYEPIQEGRTWAEGRWGRPFVSSETEFDCYGPYCANYLDAIALVNEQMGNLQRGQDLPPDQRPCLHPETELQAFMIKPIQRITKYGLLLDAVLNATKKHDYAYRGELEEGAAAVRRIANSINEVTDYRAKQATVRELMDRVEDWKGHELDKFGDLWLDDHFTVTKADQPRDYHVFLFDKMLLCCKEVIPERKKSTKSSSMLRKDKTASKVSIPERRKLALKGRIFVSNINRATLTPPEEPYGPPRLTIAWTVPHRDTNGYHDDVEDSFVMVGKSEEQMKKWADKVMDLANAERKRQEELRSQHSARMSASGQSRYSTDRGPSSSFGPPTPASEHPSYGFPPPLPGQEDLDDENSMGMRSGRTTPSIGSGPAGYMSLGHNSGRRVQSQQAVSRGSFTELRARAMTEDQFGPSVSQWRNQHQAPPMPRMMSNQSSTSNVSEMSFGTVPRNMGRQMSQSRITRGIDEESESSPTDDGTMSMSQRFAPSRGMARAPSHQMTPSVPHPHAPAMRSRSASSPHVYPLNTEFGAPPIPHGQPGNNSNRQDPYPPSSTSTLVGGTAYFNKRMSGSGGKRSSGDSHSTETSETSSQISPSTPYGMPGDGIGSRQSSQEATIPTQSGTMLVKVRCADDQFIIGVSSGIVFAEFYQKVQKKIRMCRGASALSDRITIKWIDADGDEVTIKCDADVDAMIGETKDSGGNCVNIVVR